MRGPLAWLDRRIGVPPPEPGEPGDPGLFGSGSTVWRIGRERALLLGGPAALLMQIAHPLIATAVADHSDFGADPFRRLRGTLEAVLAISYGDAGQVRTAAERVRAVHDRVQGRLGAASGPFPAGSGYRAADPDLALWVHATLVWAALETYARFVRPINRSDRARYFEEARRFAALFGVTEAVMPPSLGAFESYVSTMVEGPTLTVGSEARGLAAQILAPPVPGPLAPSVPVMRVITAGLLPGRLRREFGLGWGPSSRAVFGSVAAGVRAGLRVLPDQSRFWPHYVAAERRSREARRGLRR